VPTAIAAGPAARRCTVLSATSCSGYRLPPEVLALAVRWSLRYRLRYADVAELLAERGSTVVPVTIVARVRAVAPGRGHCQLEEALRDQDGSKTGRRQECCPAQVMAGVPAAARAAVAGDRPVGGREALGVPGALEPAHPPLPLAGRLVRVLGPVVQASGLPVLDAREHRPFRRPVARGHCQVKPFGRRRRSESGE